MDGATTTVVGIIGDDPLVSRILGLLLEGLATRRVPWTGRHLGGPERGAGGVDLVLFLPLLGDERV